MKKILLTSGTSGIGKAILYHLLSDNDKNQIIVNYGHNSDTANQIYNSLSEINKKRVTFIKADLSKYSEAKNFTDFVIKKFNNIDWIILNTGIDAKKNGKRVVFGDYDIETWEKVIRTNLSIPTFIIQDLQKNINENGKILFMSSYAGIEPYSGSLVYSVSKAGIINLTKSLLKFFDHKNIAINAIAPGFIETPWQKKRTKESYDRINKKIACHRFGKSEEVAKLCIDTLNNDYINGSIIEIHGGYGYF
ncbi:SDR family oxidoreductase [Anaerofustis stercorihominis]|uniref:3-oxoacyl-[acyl-carrier-protein] reductase n=1 Tax=Anaerofustis stercorihominis DSM 17244 TaxID=445971 RepID=B1C6L9_9FIRM|nr:SDR family oxidoreductase [Anaerofustis stercorihominis]EDS72656.1 putative 3-oxoacyl-[acyl-carrier-protein] reductase [Anaerofustis stercorihominis DSM 17244]MCQ4794032.1 SDR family oxidoreductase [Anaerofustis stercorihominis]